jgi:hypothetical protein
MGLLNRLRKYCAMKKVRESATDSEKDKEMKDAEHEEMNEEQHQLDLKENYESDEKYEESKD